MVGTLFVLFNLTYGYGILPIWYKYDYFFEQYKYDY